MGNGLIAVAVALLTVAQANASVTLTGGKVAKFQDKPGSDKDSALIKFTNDLELMTPLDPRCPAASFVRISAGLLGETLDEEIPLPCDNWQASGSGFKYDDRDATAGGVRKIIYKKGKLLIRMKGPNYNTIKGPLPHVETRFGVGPGTATTFCGRFLVSRRNEPDNVIFKKPTFACEELCGDSIVEDREQCDLENLAGETCESLGYEGGGTLGCTSACTFDTSACIGQVCGNETVEGSETCDDGNTSDGDCCSSTCQLDPPGSSCSDGDACNGDETCDGDGACDAGTPLACDDGNVCTSDTCDPGSGCVNTTVPGAPCEGDGNICTDDRCDGSAACTHVNNSNPCTDGLSCTVGDTCIDGSCVGTLLNPWINEVDYDDLSGPGATSDRDEFVEVAGPAGFDLGGYFILSVEGNQTCGTGYIPGTLINTPTGDAHFIAQIPEGTVLGDDTGDGIGLYVACFQQPGGTSTSSDVGEACTDTLDAVAADSNLKNGHLTNANASSCPDGILLLDPDGDPIDAVSWEGVVPDTGPLTWGAAFYDPAVAPPYSIPRDEGGFILPLPGDASGVSIEKTTSTLSRAVDETEWLETGGCIDQSFLEILLQTCVPDMATPGKLNAAQSAALGLECTATAPDCGNGIIEAGEDCEDDGDCGTGWECSPSCACTLASLCGNGGIDFGEECDEGDGNSDLPNSTCRTNCTQQRCGDGIVDDAFGEDCEQNGDCAPEEGCFACQCAPPLGPMTFSVVTGPALACPDDDGESSFLKVAPAIAGICSGTEGDFNPGPLVLAGGAPGPDGVAELTLANGPVVIGASVPDPLGIPTEGYACFEFTQDPSNTGWIDCDGGSNAGVTLTVNSNGAGEAGPPVLTVGAGGSDSGVGAAVIRVLIRGAMTESDSEDCSMADFSGEPQSATALTTGTVYTTIEDPIQTGLAVVSLAGAPLDCGNWTENGGGSIVAANANMDVPVPVFGTLDIAQALRLNDD